MNSLTPFVANGLPVADGQRHRGFAQVIARLADPANAPSVAEA
jgi:hypothetical protein